MPARVQVLETARAGDSQELWGFSIDRPQPGEQEGDYTLRIEGWALGRRAPVSAIELLEQDALVWRLPLAVERADLSEAFPQAEGATRGGFSASVSALALPGEFDLSVVAALEDGARVELGTVRGRRAPLRSSFEPRLSPLMITALGRTGSTMVTRLLASHPQVVAYRPFEYEPRVASYWIDVLRELSEPASYLRQFSPAGSLKERGWWLGTREPLPRSIPESEIEGWMGSSAVEALAAFCQSRIDALYGRIAEQSGRSDALYFAEKFRLQAMPLYVPRLVHELFPAAREVFLVRDFRDMVCSVFAFDRKRGYAGFGRPADATDEEYVRGKLRQIVLSFEAAWKSRAARSYLVHYEDLVLRPTDTLARLLDHLGLEASASTIESMLSEVSGLTGEVGDHGTSPTPTASVGRWRHDLSPELQRACELALGPALETFGYSAAA